MRSPTIITRIGIRREDKNKWERRVPLTPKHVSLLKSQNQIETLIQPSPIRIYEDKEYFEIGATVEEDLSSCSVILGVKEMPVSFFEPGKAYMFFSHTIKGQKHNMPMLKRLMELGCHLLDYERVLDEKGKRILFFGRYAGLAGMIDSLWAFGQRLLWEGIETPFSKILKTYQYRSLAEAKRAVEEAGQQFSDPIYSLLHPIVFGFAGYGHVSQGAQEVFNLMPHQEISPQELLNWDTVKEQTSNKLIKVVFREEDMMEPVRDGARFILQEYYDHPENYRSRFDRYLPYLTVLINAIFWKSQYPRLVTKKNLRQLFENNGKPNLRVIGDITCDIEGSIECTLHATEPDNPVYIYNPITGATKDGVEGLGPVVLGVDNLPCELPRSSSEFFGNSLFPYIPEISRLDMKKSYDQCCLSREIKNAVILYKGELTPAYNYLESFVKD